MHKCIFFTTFALDMKKQLLLILFCLAFFSAHAETLVLRTGTRVQGTIVFQNEEVVILKNAEGARFQYPRADVLQILSDEEAASKTTIEVAQEEEEIKTTKKASILLELAGGAAIKPGEAAGGGFSADLLVGSHHIKDRHLFIGGGLGYHGLFLGPEKYNFLPIQVALRMPFTESKHAPVFGASLGYGIALSRDYLGGLYAGLDFGYRCQLNPRTALALVAYAQFQQATVTNTLIIEDTPFTQKAGRNLITSGLKLAFYF